VLRPGRTGKWPVKRSGSRPVAGVMVVDLDGFTACNAAVGRAAADLVLSQVARRLRLAVPPQHTLARWGGDEFAVLVEDAASPAEVIDMAHRLARGLTAVPFQVGDVEVTLTASVGVALADGGSAGRAWRHAEAALTVAKAAGPGQVEVYGATHSKGGDGVAALTASGEDGHDAGGNGNGHPAAGDDSTHADGTESGPAGRAPAGTPAA